MIYLLETFLKSTYRKYKHQIIMGAGSSAQTGPSDSLSKSVSNGGNTPAKAPSTPPRSLSRKHSSTSKSKSSAMNELVRVREERERKTRVEILKAEKREERGDKRRKKASENNSDLSEQDNNPYTRNRSKSTSKLSAKSTPPEFLRVQKTKGDSGAGPGPGAVLGGRKNSFSSKGNSSGISATSIRKRSSVSSKAASRYREGGDSNAAVGSDAYGDLNKYVVGKSSYNDDDYNNDSGDYSDLDGRKGEGGNWNSYMDMVEMRKAGGTAPLIRKHSGVMTQKRNVLPPKIEISSSDSEDDDDDGSGGGIDTPNSSRESQSQIDPAAHRRITENIRKTILEKKLAAQTKKLKEEKERAEKQRASEKARADNAEGELRKLRAQMKREEIKTKRSTTNSSLTAEISSDEEDDGDQVFSSSPSKKKLVGGRPAPNSNGTAGMNSMEQKLKDHLVLSSDEEDDEHGMSREDLQVCRACARERRCCLLVLLQ